MDSNAAQAAPTPSSGAIAAATCVALAGEPTPVDAADSRDGLIVIEAALRSSLERRTVALV